MWQVIRRILLVILGHLCQETLVRMLFVLILDRSSLLYNKISGSDVRKSLWDPSGTHLSLACQVISKVPIY
jgi:hypothetical protein